MAAYVIVDIDVKNSVEYARYKDMAAPVVASFGGKYLARGGKTETLEGSWVAKRLVILEFPTTARAKEWLHSEEYSAARALRHKTAESNMIIVDGV
ncbi:MAG TPA: DUF1330 domain-containing protein [Anaerolineae bacterium]